MAPTGPNMNLGFSYGQVINWLYFRHRHETDTTSHIPPLHENAIGDGYWGIATMRVQPHSLMNALLAIRKLTTQGQNPPLLRAAQIKMRPHNIPARGHLIVSLFSSANTLEKWNVTQLRLQRPAWQNWQNSHHSQKWLQQTWNSLHVSTDTSAAVQPTLQIKTQVLPPRAETGYSGAEKVDVSGTEVRLCRTL